MNAPKRSDVSVDHYVYLGDPDTGAKAIPSSEVLENFEAYKDQLPAEPDVYGAIVVTRDGEELADRVPDPIVKLLTTLIRALPYIIDGGPETALMSETENGFLFERAADKVLISFFIGSDAFDPDGFHFDAEPIEMLDFGNQLVGMCERHVALMKKADPTGFEDNEDAQDLVQFLELGHDAARSYRLEKEHGLR